MWRHCAHFSFKRGYMSSILSYPERGHWGDNKYRGNCSGHIYVDLFTQLQPKTFVDPMMGSGTSIEVANEMGIQAVGLDLRKGFNILRDSIVDCVGYESDLVISHPPYGGCIKYSGPGGMWGDAPHPDDLSHCATDAEFHEKLQVALLNQRQATKEGYIYGTIIGDWRRQGVYTSYQAECIARMPQDELAGVLIKQQHQTTSGRKAYRKMPLPMITHEYIILWRRKARTIYQVLAVLAREQAGRLSGSWRSIVRNVVMMLGGSASLQKIYEEVARGCPEKVQQNPNWQAKVRQVVNSTGDYIAAERGVWRLA
jgi:hypothetical protein